MSYYQIDVSLILFCKNVGGDIFAPVAATRSVGIQKARAAKSINLCSSHCLLVSSV